VDRSFERPGSIYAATLHRSDHTSAIEISTLFLLSCSALPFLLPIYLLSSFAAADSIPSLNPLPPPRSFPLGSIRASPFLAIADRSSCLASTATTSGSSLTYNNCSIGANSDSGCTYNITNANSYGAGFAAAGGGVYVAEFASSGVKVWFLTVSGVDPTRASPSIARRSLAHVLHFPNPYHPHAQVCERFLSNDCIILFIVP
jgi:hypothetical protein